MDSRRASWLMRVADSPATASGTAETPNDSRANFGNSFTGASFGGGVLLGSVGRDARVGRGLPGEGAGQRAPAGGGIEGPHGGLPLARGRLAHQLRGAGQAGWAVGRLEQRGGRGELGPQVNLRVAGEVLTHHMNLGAALRFVLGRGHAGGPRR